MSSGAGKTQLLLTLLLAVQLPPPHGLAKPAIYISTEAMLSTTRLTQLLSSHPALASLSPEDKPSLSRVLSIQTPDLEAQDHILRYQLPVAIEQHGVGLVILDSVAANFRAEFEQKGPRGGAASMAKRGAQLAQLGALLRDLARAENVAIVVANQVADRFTRAPSAASSTAVSRTTSTNSQGNTGELPSQMSLASQPDIEMLLSPDPLALDHQQKWTTGWGDQQYEPEHSQKTPSLGLVWTNQIACRIALIKKPVFVSKQPVTIANGEEYFQDENHVSRWRRWMRLVFAPWTPPSDGQGIEFEITRGGLRHVVKNK